MIWIMEDSKKTGWGGGQRITLEAMRALGKRDIRLFDSTDLVLEKIRPQIPAVQFTPIVSGGKSVKGVSSFSFPLSEIFLYALHFSVNIVRIAKMARADKPDIVYCAHKKPLLPVLLLKRLGLLKARVIFHVHLIVPPRFIHRAFHALARATADVLICVSRRVFDQWEGGRRELVYNPIPPEVLIQKSPWTPGQPLRVGFVGSTTYLKGFDLFLEIAKKLGGSDRKPGYDFRVFTRTPVPEQDVPVTYFQESTGADIYRNMDVLLICSRAEESFSLTALEAAANHIPVVFPGQAALLEILTPEISGEMYQQSRVQDMVAALETLARRLEEDPRACQPQSEELLRRYSLEVFRDRMREIFSGSDYPHASPDKGQTP